LLAGDSWPGRPEQWPELWRSVAEAVPDSLLIVSQDGTILYLNRDIEGLAPQSVRGGKVFDYVPGALRSELEGSLAEVFGGAPARVREVAVVLPDRRERWYATYTTPVIHDGRVVAAAIVARDVTETRLAVLGRLAAGIAHDFHNILMVVRASVEVLREELPGDHPLRLDVEWINEATRKGAALTSQLLALARCQELNAEPVELNTLTRDALGLLGRLLGPRVKLVNRLEPMGAPVRADRSQLEQVLFNLVLNARDAMPQGGTLTVSTSRVPARVWPVDAPCRVTGPIVRLRVEDTGVGMDEATRRQIFTPFFSTKTDGKGNGLGLAIVDAAVKRAGGCLEVVSRPGRGTTFDVILPDAEALQASQA
jgi:PAS domain S-box-containing protein